LTFWSKNLFFI